MLKLSNNLTRRNLKEGWITTTRLKSRMLKMHKYIKELTHVIQEIKTITLSMEENPHNLGSRDNKTFINFLIS